MMSKRATRKRQRIARKTITEDEMALRRYCIDSARGWPTITERSYGQSSFGGPQIDKTTDIDLIGRAEKIYTWMTRTVV